MNAEESRFPRRVTHVEKQNKTKKKRETRDWKREAENEKGKRREENTKRGKNEKTKRNASRGGQSAAIENDSRRRACREWRINLSSHRDRNAAEARVEDERAHERVLHRTYNAERARSRISGLNLNAMTTRAVAQLEAAMKITEVNWRFVEHQKRTKRRRLS